jgi:predicted flap endonuclease-1-like 5' DNA nuclease
MSSVWSVIYIVATTIFIGWLLYRVRFPRQDPPGSRDPAVRHEIPTGGAGSKFHDQMATAGTRSAVDRAASPQAAARVDDLTRIKGIGKVIAPKLHAMGIVSFAQIACLSGEDIERINEVLAFKGRIEREDWIGQAQRLVVVMEERNI